MISPPNGDVNGKLRVLLFDAYHDEYRGVICLVEIIDGSLREGMRVTSAATQQSYDVLEVERNRALLDDWRTHRWVFCLQRLSRADSY